MSCETTSRGLIKMCNWNYPKRGEKQGERKYLRQYLLKKKKNPNLMKSINPESRKSTNLHYKKKTTRHITIKLLKSNKRNL